MNRKFMSYLFILLICSSIFFVALSSQAEARKWCGIDKRDVIKGLFATLRGDGHNHLERRHVMTMIRAYLGSLDCSDRKNQRDVDEAKNKIDNLSGNIVPSCSDGTPFMSCSGDAPKYCYMGRLVIRCDFCCTSGKCESDGKTCADSDPSETEVCTDSDDGKDFDLKGTVTDYSSSTHVDYCEDGVLYEYFCSKTANDGWTYEMHLCSELGFEGCSDGACYGAVTYLLTVNSGLGSGSYPAGEMVTITANSPRSGMVFDKWTGSTSYVDGITSSTTTVNMPGRAITVTATYKTDSSGTNSDTDSEDSGTDGGTDSGDSSTDSNTDSGDSGTDSGTNPDDPYDTSRCMSANLVWKSGSHTWYESYPDPGSEECEEYNGCTWAGQFAACDGKKTEQWVESHNIVSAFPSFNSLKLHDLCLRSGDKYIVVTVLDTCADSDCSGCCSQNLGSSDQLIDVESYTDNRWGVSAEKIEWTDLGPTITDGCD